MADITENPYEQELDELIEQVNADDGMPVDALNVVLSEFNTRLLARILVRLDEISEMLKKE